MPKLKIKARLFYPPGPWGRNKPVRDAKVVIHDLDINGQDKIFTDTSDAAGRVSGTSKDWQDKTNIRYWHVTSAFPPAGEWRNRSAPDLTDIMALTINVKADGQEMTLPFPFVGDNVEVPVTVTWFPPPNMSGHGRVNNKKFTDFQGLIDTTTKKIERGDDLELTLFGEWSEAVEPLVNIVNTPPLDLIKPLFPGSREGSVVIVVGGIFVTLTGAEIAAIILSIGALILLSGAAVFVTALGIAVIAAIAAGYCRIEAGQETVQDPVSGMPTNRTLIRLSKDC